ncbi:MAG: hypothetical protein J6X94_03985 [Lachnospiraceae bacterium]|nr:hypothetical protein [Lachnospiraceae bacterium]
MQKTKPIASGDNSSGDFASRDFTSGEMTTEHQKSVYLLLSMPMMEKNNVISIKKHETINL